MAICFLLDFFSRRVSFLGKLEITGRGEVKETISSISVASLLVGSVFILDLELTSAILSTLASVMLTVEIVLLFTPAEKVPRSFAFFSLIALPRANLTAVYFFSQSILIKYLQRIK